MLEARGVTIAYGRRVAVAGADLRIGAGELVALCGPNGSGKSSLIGVMSGDLKPDLGEALIGGAPVAAFSVAALARRRAALEQSPTLSAPFTVAVLAGLAIPREVPPAVAAEIAARAMAAVGLAHRADERVHSLSGGQQRRAHLARALAQLEAGRSLGGGEALTLDEPTAGLDFAHQIRAMRAARVAADSGAAVLAALHDLSLAAAFADRIVLMRAGRIVTDEAPRAALSSDRLSEIYETPMCLFEAPDGGLCAVPSYLSPPFHSGASRCLSP
ncbi:MAG: ATP-binding cassette domain-containing protein [Paracoccaceae bacterium]